MKNFFRTIIAFLFMSGLVFAFLEGTKPKTSIVLLPESCYTIIDEFYTEINFICNQYPFGWDECWDAIDPLLPEPKYCE